VPDVGTDVQRVVRGVGRDEERVASVQCEGGPVFRSRQSELSCSQRPHPAPKAHSSMLLAVQLSAMSDGTPEAGTIAARFLAQSMATRM